MPTTILVAPAGHGVGLTTACLGIVRALDRQGLRVGFVKPIANRRQIQTSALMTLVGHSAEPSLDRDVSDELLASGDDQLLMEHVVEVAGRAGQQVDVLVVEAMALEPGVVYATRVNQLMLKALDAELVLVASPRRETPEHVAEQLAIAARGYGVLSEGRKVACILNRVCGGAGAPRNASSEVIGPACADCQGVWRCERAGRPRGGAPRGARSRVAAPGRRRAVQHRPVGATRARHRAPARRADALGRPCSDAARARHRRVRRAPCPTALTVMKPGTLIITPGDRNDVLLTAAVAVQDGVPLAGVLLTAGLEPHPSVVALCKKAVQAGLPLLAVTAGTYRAVTSIASMDPGIPVDDADRVERTMNAVADCVDVEWVNRFSTEQRVPRLSPPAFRHRLVEAARADLKRIVLPEGAEPRTVEAAAIVASRGIARCVLLGNPEEIHDVAEKQGVVLPPSVEIVDVMASLDRYVAPLVERRKSKGMTPERAVVELQDPIMLGTMMLALDEADGLVSGAVHSTAHTIRPALQIIKTQPGCNLVSSIFFMCLPDQVLVFGDCAVVPNPTAPELADIAIQSAESAIAFGIPARVAMLSYSTGTSGSGEDVEKVMDATKIAKHLRPDLAIDGPLQYDAAVMPDVARLKAPTSPVAGRATVLVFPDLNTGNVTYKAVQRSANVVSMGPMLQGLAKPVNDLSRGCLVEDIVFTINLTAIQAQQAARRKS